MAKSNAFVNATDNNMTYSPSDMTFYPNLCTDANMEGPCNDGTMVNEPFTLQSNIMEATGFA